MDDLKVYYDDQEDILYLAKAGQEKEVVELYPGVNIDELVKSQNVSP